MRYRSLLRRSSLLLIPVILQIATAPASADLWGTSIDPYSTAPPELQDQYNKVFRFDTQGSKLPNDIGHASAGLNYPTGIVVSPDGNIYVSSYGSAKILFYDGQTGSPLSLDGGPAGVFVDLSMDTAGPAQLAFGPDGNLYVSEYFGTSVRVYDAETGERLADAATGLTSAGGLAFAPNGDLLIGDGFSMSESDFARVVRVHDGVQTTFGDTGQGYLAAPTALQFLPNGDLLVVDLLANYIARFDANGQSFQPFAVIPPEIPDPLPGGVFVPSNNPSDIDFDQNGNLIVSVLGLTSPPDNRGALLRYALDGTPLAPLSENLEPIGGIAWTPSVKTLQGDYDGNGVVEPADYTEWREDFGKWVARGNGADGNGDGLVDAADYTVWRDAYAPSAGAGLIHAVPEPASGALLLLGAAAVALTLPSPKGRGF